MIILKGLIFVLLWAALIFLNIGFIISSGDKTDRSFDEIDLSKDFYPIDEYDCYKTDDDD